jgi:hypothetical protein
LTYYPPGFCVILSIYKDNITILQKFWRGKKHFFFLWWVFWARVSRTTCPDWLRTVILLISPSWVVRIIGVSNWLLALLLLLFWCLLDFFHACLCFLIPCHGILEEALTSLINIIRPKAFTSYLFTRSYSSGIVFALTKFWVLKPFFLSSRYSGWNHSKSEW